MNHKNNRKSKNKSNDKKIVFFSFLFVMFLSIGILLLINSFSFEKKKIIDYSEKSNIDYKVYLKENNFYESEYLDKDMLYVASLIDKININFDYFFTIDEAVDMDLNYSIIGKLLITDLSGEKKYYEKDYVLLEPKSININNKVSEEIKETLDIDYAFYNNIVNEFRTGYGISTQDKFVIYMKVDKKNNNSSEINIGNTNYMSFTIPLSEKSVNIQMSYNELDETSYVVDNSDFMISSIICFVIAILCVIISLVFLIKCIRIFNKNRNVNYYNNYVKRILKEYDRMIVETSNLPNTNELNIIKIEKFSELIDVHDNLKLPIMYYIVEENKKCWFYIKHEDTLYLKIITSLDLKK